jgi:SAM-dependent methyltransferase
MTETFGKDGWEAHWEAVHPEHRRRLPPNPHLVREVGDLEPGTALDAGCGEGAEAVWLATTGWRVTAADISAAALDRARRRTAGDDHAAAIEWVEADLSLWEPRGRFDLVTTHYAHPTIGQLAFYERIADGVAPGGTLLIVGHLDHHDHSGVGHEPPATVCVTADAVAGLLDPAEWNMITANEISRTLADASGRTRELHDVVVRARRSDRQDHRPHER